MIGAAASNGHAEIINFVMGKTNHKSIIEFKAIMTGGDPNDPGQKDYTPLQLALRSPKFPLDAIKALYEYGANMKVFDHNDCSILHLAAESAA